MSISKYSTQELIEELEKRRDEIDTALFSHKPDLVARVISAACKAFEVPKEVVLANNKSMVNINPRWAVMNILRASGFSYPEIASVFKMDHGSVMYAITKHKDRLATIPAYKMGFSALLQNLKTPA